MKRTLILLMSLALTGCVTTSTVGSRPWHEERVAEIDSAYDAYEIDEQEYLDLMNDADQIRSDYLDRLEERRSRRSYSIGIGYGYYGHRFHHHHHPRWGHRHHW